MYICIYTQVFRLDLLEVSLGLFLPCLGQLVKHTKLQSHHLHLLMVVGVVCPQVIHQSHAKLLLLQTNMTQNTQRKKEAVKADVVYKYPYEKIEKDS